MGITSINQWYHIYRTILDFFTDGGKVEYLLDYIRNPDIRTRQGDEGLVRNINGGAKANNGGAGMNLIAISWSKIFAFWGHSHQIGVRNVSKSRRAIDLQRLVADGRLHADVNTEMTS